MSATHWHQGRVAVAQAVQEEAARQARDFLPFRDSLHIREDGTHVAHRHIGRSYASWHMEGLREAYDACGPREDAKRERLAMRMRGMATYLIGRCAS
jgi:hypothetical protein